MAELQARTITKLTPQKNNPDRASVFLDGAFAFGVQQRLLLKYNLHVGRTLTPDEQREIEQEDAVAEAKAAAFDYLAHKPRTEKEVRRKLRKRDFSDVVTDQVVERLHELSYLGDADYAREYVRARFSSKGYGPVRIRRELQKRGVGRHEIEDAMHEQMDAAATLAAAREHARAKWDRLDPDEDPRRQQQKLYGYLRRRGFTPDTIRRVTDELAREA